MYPYIFLFIDSIKSAVAFLPNSDMAYIVMQAFGTYNCWIMLSLATTAGLLGSLLNYLVGYLVRHIKNGIRRFTDTDKLLNLQNIADKYLIYLCVFSFLPLWGVVLTLAAGFLRVRLVKFAIVILISKLVYYLLII